MLGFLPGTGRRGAVLGQGKADPLQTLQAGQWESCASRGGQKMSQHVLYRP